MRRPRGGARLLAGLLVVLLLAGGALAVVLTRGGDDPARVPAGGSSFGEPARAANPGRTPLARGEQAAAEQPKAGLPLPPARAAARLMLVGFEGTSPSAGFFGRLRERRWGGVVLERGNFVDAAQFAALAGEVTVVARDAGAGAPLVAALPDFLPGFDATATGTQARSAARRLRAAGVRLALAPVGSLGSAGGPWDDLAYGDDPAAVARDVRAAVEGFRAGGVAAVPGRFPGEGAATQDPSLGVASVGLGLEELRDADVLPFAAVADRAPAIQMSSALYVAFDAVTPATLLPDAVAELRRTGFKGAVVSADLAVTTLATGSSVAEAAVAALRAGCDLLWVPGDAAAQEETYRALVRAIRDGDVPAQRVRDALAAGTRLKRDLRLG
jgi:beta-N-acetylhexosaminidase